MKSPVIYDTIQGPDGEQRSRYVIDVERIQALEPAEEEPEMVKAAHDPVDESEIPF